MAKQKILIIAGPTCVGKTSTAIKLSKCFGGEIISCDSVQVYKHLNIGSAKATLEEQFAAPHALIDVVEPQVDFSVAEYKQLAEQQIKKISKNINLPIFVGGTGLYIKSVLFPFNFSN